SGDIAVDRGDYDWTLTPAKGGADVHAKGRYVTIWHRQSDGLWKASRLIWNSSEPMPKAQYRKRPSRARRREGRLQYLLTKAFTLRRLTCRRSTDTVEINSRSMR